MSPLLGGTKDACGLCTVTGGEEVHSDRKKGINMSYSSQKLITFPESWDLMRWQYYSAALPSWFSHWYDSG